MHDIALLEEYYGKYIRNLSRYLPEGIAPVDLELLQQFDLLHFHSPHEQESNLTRYFHVIESPEKITLINEQFVVWILPENFEGVAATLVLIALREKEKPRLETAFLTQGVYNTSRLVLRILEKFLIEIQENEELLKRFKEAS